MRSYRFITPVIFLFVLLSGSISYAIDVSLTQIDSYDANCTVSQIEYSPVHQLLFLREAGTSVHVIDLQTNTEIANHQATEQFTDMDLTADSNYLFVADYGGERTGYGDPIRPHYVHRYDLQNRTWTIAQAPKIAWKIEAVSP
ncbi:MAG: hypothetical protein JW806_07330, partial [Sedimentisphaerales bacterium]|nr:hypothetical protein [Sedimentisphaerales bacterium]